VWSLLFKKALLSVQHNTRSTVKFQNTKDREMLKLILMLSLPHLPPPTHTHIGIRSRIFTQFGGGVGSREDCDKQETVCPYERSSRSAPAEPHAL